MTSMMFFAPAPHEFMPIAELLADTVFEILSIYGIEFALSRISALYNPFSR